MCGRFTLRTLARDLVEIVELLREPGLSPRYNIAPTQRVAVVRHSAKDREFAVMRWGLVPSWEWRKAKREATRAQTNRRQLGTWQAVHTLNRRWRLN